MIGNIQGKRVADLMSSAVTVTVDMNQTWGQVAREMVKRGSELATVVDDKNRPVGLLSRFDLLNLVLPEGESLSRKRLRDLQPKMKPVTVYGSAPLWDAINSMDIRQVCALIVIDDEDKFSGVLTASDIIRLMVQ